MQDVKMCPCTENCMPVYLRKRSSNSICS